MTTTSRMLPAILMMTLAVALAAPAAEAAPPECRGNKHCTDDGSSEPPDDGTDSSPPLTPLPPIPPWKDCNILMDYAPGACVIRGLAEWLGYAARLAAWAADSAEAAATELLP